MGDGRDDRAARPRPIRCRTLSPPLGRSIRLKRSIRRVWAGPASLLGLALCGFFDHRFVTRGIVLAEGARWPRKLGWRYRAVTLGHVVLAVDELDERVLEHETVHVRQFERWGPLFLLVYPLASLGTWLRGGHPYRDNPFEVQARRGEGSGREKSPRAGGGSSSLSTATAGRGSGVA